MKNKKFVDLIFKYSDRQQKQFGFPVAYLTKTGKLKVVLMNGEFEQLMIELLDIKPTLSIISNLNDSDEISNVRLRIFKEYKATYKQHFKANRFEIKAKAKHLSI
jgi:hypothetical protein